MLQTAGVQQKLPLPGGEGPASGWPCVTTLWRSAPVQSWWARAVRAQLCCWYHQHSLTEMTTTGPNALATSSARASLALTCRYLKLGRWTLQHVKVAQKFIMKKKNLKISILSLLYVVQKNWSVVPWVKGANLDTYGRVEGCLPSEGPLRHHSSADFQSAAGSPRQYKTDSALEGQGGEVSR